jgi:uncharacterized membrane protein YfcA
VILAAVLGAVAGILSGMFGIGGGILFVPTLALVLSLSQVKAEATSLLAIVPVALVGAIRQYRYGNVEVRDGLIVGALSAVGVAGGVVLANVLPNRTLRVLFAAVMVLVALQFVRRFVRRRGVTADDAAGAPGSEGAPEGARTGGVRREAERAE